MPFPRHPKGLSGSERHRTPLCQPCSFQAVGVGIVFTSASTADPSANGIIAWIAGDTVLGARGEDGYGTGIAFRTLPGVRFCGTVPRL